MPLWRILLYLRNEPNNSYHDRNVRAMEKDSIVYRKLVTNDETAFAGLVRLFNREFESVDPEYVNAQNIELLLGRPEFVCIAAFDGDEIVGGITAYELRMYDRPGSAMYLYDLAVAEKTRRRGIGSGLVRELQAYCRRTGIRELFVQADSSDEHALAFYDSLSGRPSMAVQYSFDLV
ncbi:GNAT family N-acetyltransferase [Cohnella candidum]|uniref:GNAT family N-acetyltransferase n=1 Tax=Cohnella candidum TaxID=2674991 RepID=A0A3G3JW69_9BACL|nr:GNAT family N-acetyltransferase [Cohnella candidum]